MMNKTKRDKPRFAVLLSLVSLGDGCPPFKVIDRIKIDGVLKKVDLAFAFVPCLYCIYDLWFCQIE